MMGVLRAFFEKMENCLLNLRSEFSFKFVVCSFIQICSLVLNFNLQVTNASPLSSCSQLGSRSHLGFCSLSVTCASRSGSGCSRYTGTKEVWLSAVQRPASAGALRGECRPRRIHGTSRLQLRSSEGECVAACTMLTDLLTASYSWNRRVGMVNI